MARDSSQSRKGSIPQIDKNALWTVGFALLAVACLVLIIVVPNTLLRVLFLIIAIGAGVYCWLMILDRRGRPKAVKPAEPAMETAEEPAPVEVKAAEEQPEGKATGETAEPSGPVVFVSSKGDKYHRGRDCVGLRFADDVDTIAEEEAVRLGRKPCSKCLPKEN